MAISSVFMSNRSQAVRIPSEARLPDHVKRVEVRVVGQERVITPVDQLWDSFFGDCSPLPKELHIERGAQSPQVREGLD
jgi:antitoxin VapB